MNVDGVDAAKGPCSWLRCWRKWSIENGEDCIVIRWSIREARDGNGRITGRGDEKVKGIAISMCRKVDMLCKIEVSEQG